MLREAVGDLDTGRTYYDERENGVGDYFYDNLIGDIESLFIFAGVHAQVNGLYRMFSKRFPYAVYYDISDDIAYVVAVLPMRRDPIWLENELAGRY